MPAFWRCHLASLCESLPETEFWISKESIFITSPLAITSILVPNTCMGSSPPPSSFCLKCLPQERLVYSWCCGHISRLSIYSNLQQTQHFKHAYQGCALQWSLDHRVLWTKLRWILSKSEGVWQSSLVIIDCEPIAVLVGVGIPYVWKGDHKFVECNVFLFRGLSVVTILCSPWGVAIVLLQYSLLFWVYLYFVPTMWLLYHLLTTCQL